MRFVKFRYSGIEIESDNEEKVQAVLTELVVEETCKYLNGPVDSLAKLHYKSSLKYGSIKFHQICGQAHGMMMAE